jgi:hypothetical protein
MKMQSREWATLVVAKGQGGRAKIINSSQRGLFREGDSYFNHRLHAYPKGSRLNVVVRLSATGRRMVQDIRVK